MSTKEYVAPYFDHLPLERRITKLDSLTRKRQRRLDNFIDELKVVTRQSNYFLDSLRGNLASNGSASQVDRPLDASTLMELMPERKRQIECSLMLVAYCQQEVNNLTNDITEKTRTMNHLLKEWHKESQRSQVFDIQTYAIYRIYIKNSDNQ